MIDINIPLEEASLCRNCYDITTREVRYVHTATKPNIRHSMHLELQKSPYSALPKDSSYHKFCFSNVVGATSADGVPFAGLLSCKISGRTGGGSIPLPPKYFENS